MVIALYGNTIESEHRDSIILLLNEFAKRNAEVIIYAPFHDFLEQLLGYRPTAKALFRKPGEVKHLANFMLSIGGDGTFLESVSYIEESCIPVVGINFGRLGFLAHISSSDIPSAIDQLFKGEYTVEDRTALELLMDSNPFNKFPFALNDITIQKMGTSMITINAYIDNEFLCTYWADGLIVSTPTGSTAYSLSVGGPIVSPNTNAIVISPIAPHHLTVRPLVIPDASKLSLKVTARDKEILISVDSRSELIPCNSILNISKANFCVGVVRLLGTSYYKTLRNKLMWGVDSRNNV
jgi:NAD+ kinase